MNKSKTKRTSKISPSVLTIAGSDSGGGAGIQADLKTIAAHNLHGLSVITAITAQNTRAVLDVQTVSEKLIRAQLSAVFNDFDIRAIKIGMLANVRVIRIVAEELKKAKIKQKKIWVVLDPVMVASTGASLLDPSAVRAMIKYLFPLSHLITPNLPEAEKLIGEKILAAEQISHAAIKLQKLGVDAVLIKGGHLTKGDIFDVLLDGKTFHVHQNKRIHIEGHGTGCTLSSAIAANLAKNFTLPTAVGLAIAYVKKGLVQSYKPGNGSISVLQHILSK